MSTSGTSPKNSTSGLTRSFSVSTVLLEVLKADPALARLYLQDERNDVKAYDDGTLPPARRAMAELQADPVKARRAASWHLDHLAKQKNKNVSVTDPVAAYRRALADVQNQFPNLARCAEDGYIDGNDYQLLAMLVPSVGGEIERGNYSRCECGENRALCRGRKLAHQRGVDEDAVQAFAACVKDAQLYGDQLDAIRCYFK